jgi:FtsZ-binding cell division protein ZapB
MDELREKYKTQLRDYETSVNRAIESEDASQIPVLQAKNVAIAQTLDKMIETLTFLKKETPSIKDERNELVGKLKTIQRDYNGLKSSTDQLETLRRIRQQESGEANRQLYLYFGFFLLVCLIIIVYLAFMSHKKVTTAASASIPPTTAALV